MSKPQQPSNAAQNSSSTYTLVLCDGISDESKYKVEMLLRSFSHRSIRLDVVICSDGGDPHAAFVLGHLLHEKASYLRVIIPLHAKSAATLVSLAADEIVMGSISEMGPLDMQIEHPDDGRMISALDHVGALASLSDFSSQRAIASTIVGIKYFRLPRETAWIIGLQDANDFVARNTTSVDPILLKRSERALDIGMEYAAELLNICMFADVPNSQAKANQIAEELVTGFVDHSYVINVSAAKELGLRVNHADDVAYQYLEHLIDVLRVIMESEQPCIRLLNQSQLQFVCDDPITILWESLPSGNDKGANQETKAS